MALLPLLLIGEATVAVLIILMIGIIARHDGVVRLLGHRTENLPAYRRHQLIYHLGQLHRAMAIALVGWVLIAAALQLNRSPHVAAVLTVVALALGSMVWTARDSARGPHHDRFELIHHCVGAPALVALVAVAAVETVGAF